MAKSQSESSLLPLLGKRGKGSYEADSRDSPRGRERCLARAKNIVFRHCEECSDEATPSPRAA